MQASYTLPVTQVLADMVAHRDVPHERIKVIHNGINESVYDAVDFNSRAKTDTEDIVIGFTGFINKWHKIDLALEAIAQLKDKNLRFICVGEGDIRPDLEAQARKLGIEDKVEFTGLVNRDKVFSYVAQFDIALQPDITEYASPLKMFEYLGIGSLIVAPRTNNILEILDDDNAILFDPDKEGDFKDRLLFAIEHFNDHSDIRQNAYETIETKQFTWQGNARTVISLAPSSAWGMAPGFKS